MRLGSVLALSLLCACELPGLLKDEYCGDGIVNRLESCDDGNFDDSDACPSTCQPASCGDGFVELGVEECDNGPANNDTTQDACRTDCHAAHCGDGVRDASEGCDDGNSSEDDACLSTCVSARCGDGIVQHDVEQCDNGAANSNTAPDACRKNCTNSHCGDGVIDSGEECDDRNTADTDYCRNSCVIARCGDGVIRYAFEDCDDGPANSDTAPNACRTNCMPAHCGDGVPDIGEPCDDGNTSQNDYCLVGCIPNTCGDGIVNYYAENCEDLNTYRDDGCVACRTARCGDGALWEGLEQCDDGSANNDLTPNACRTTCTRPSCGDGVMDSGEICDDGVATASCDVDCTRPSCSDGVTNVASGETCDDGNRLDGDGCSSTCLIEASWVVYVNAAATGANNGTSWPDAYVSLRDALANTTQGEIWVATGTYVPDVGSGVTADDPFATFRLRSNVSLYGGFVGNEIARVQRGTAQTILDGRITSTTSVHHIVTAIGVTAVRLDGFTIKNGFDTDVDGGAALLVRGSTLRVERCSFTLNTRQLNDATQDADGGSIYSDASDLTIANSTVSGYTMIQSTTQPNLRAQGGSIYARGGRLTLRDSVIAGIAEFSGEARGGAIYLEGTALDAISTLFGGGARAPTSAGGSIFLDAASATIYSSKFENSYSNPWYWTGQACAGGAIYASGGSELMVVNTLFDNDTASCPISYGGAIYVGAPSARLETRNCTFGDNASTGTPGVHKGGAIYVASSGTAEVHNAVLWHNGATDGPDIFAEPLATATVTYSCTQTAGWGTGSIQLTRSPFPVKTYLRDAPYRLVPDSVCIDAGDNSAVPADVFDIDEDGDVIEPLLRDLFGAPRFIDDPDRSDNGTGMAPIVDMGCYEHH